MDDDFRFVDFVAERADALLRYGYVLSGNPHDAADLTQEALIRLHRAWPRVRRKHDPEATPGDHGPAAHQRLAAAPSRAARLGSAGRAALDVLPWTTEQELWQALEGLPRKQRAVLVLRYYEQLTDAEIAGCSVSPRDRPQPRLPRPEVPLRLPHPATRREQERPMNDDLEDSVLRRTLDHASGGHRKHRAIWPAWSSHSLPAP